MMPPPTPIVVNPLYSLADIVQIRLARNLGRIKAHRFTKLPLGIWNLDTDIHVEHDFLTETSCGAFIKLRGDLWGYIVVDNLDYPRDHMVLFNGTAAKLTLDNVKEFATGGAATSIAKVALHIVAAFEYTTEWKSIEPTDMVTRYLAQHITSVGERHQNRSRSTAANK